MKKLGQGEGSRISRAKRGLVRLLCIELAAALPLIGFLASTDAKANEASAGKKPDGQSLDVPSSYCGVCCLFRAARALGQSFDFQMLLRPEYISSREGSSIEELCRAAADHGLYPQPMPRMTCAMLRQVECPVILHVKSDLARSRKYDHWILFLGSQSDKARVCDGVQPVQEVEFAELAARWDGVGLLISDRPISLAVPWFVFTAQLLFSGGVVACLLSILLFLQNRWTKLPLPATCKKGWRRAGVELVMVALVAVLLGVGMQCVYADSFLSSPTAISAIQDQHLLGFLPEVKAKEVSRILAAKDVVVVDARFPKDFTSGHLAHARNIPPNATMQQCQEIIADVPSSNRILLYCESNGCPYSEIVARKLIGLGYSNILYFRDGWVGWQKHQEVASRE